MIYSPGTPRRHRSSQVFDAPDAGVSSLLDFHRQRNVSREGQSNSRGFFGDGKERIPRSVVVNLDEIHTGPLQIVHGRFGFAS
jgi:hypothetical protein